MIKVFLSTFICFKTSTDQQNTQLVSFDCKICKSGEKFHFDDSTLDDYMKSIQSTEDVNFVGNHIPWRYIFQYTIFSKP